MIVPSAEQIRQRLAKISPYPWKTTWNIKFGPAIWDADGHIMFRGESGVEHARISDADPIPQWQKDEEFVRRAPEDIAHLLTLLDTLSQEVERLKQENQMLLTRSGKQDDQRDFSIHAATDGGSS